MEKVDTTNGCVVSFHCKWYTNKDQATCIWYKAKVNKRYKMTMPCVYEEEDSETTYCTNKKAWLGALANTLDETVKELEHESKE